MEEGRGVEGVKTFIPPRKEGERVRKSKSTKGRRSSPLSRGEEKDGDVPPQTVLARVVAELEADFLHYKA
jgi:hypothetical protein